MFEGAERLPVVGGLDTDTSLLLCLLLWDYRELVLLMDNFFELPLVITCSRSHVGREGGSVGSIGVSSGSWVEVLIVLNLIKFWPQVISAPLKPLLFVSHVIENVTWMMIQTVKLLYLIGIVLVDVNEDSIVWVPIIVELHLGNPFDEVTHVNWYTKQEQALQRENDLDAFDFFDLLLCKTRKLLRPDWEVAAVKIIMEVEIFE